eukprot:7079541-Ditylum_brightwellii.AAC.1
MYSDADLARELRERISTTSIALLTNGVAAHWDISKQGEPTGATTSAELFALYKGILKVPSKLSLQIAILSLIDIMMSRSSQSSTISKKAISQWNTP